MNEPTNAELKEMILGLADVMCAPIMVNDHVFRYPYNADKIDEFIKKHSDDTE